MQGPEPVHYLPIATTVLAVIFLAVLVRHYRQRPSTHVLWWALGVFTYGLGTALEGTITLFGNSVALTKAWYVAGAFLGGYPLAQGSVFLLLQRKTAKLLTAITVPVIVVASVLVFASPVLLENLEAHRPSGSILGWSWLRLVTPFINLYAVFFLIGGALLSAWRYAKKTGVGDGERAIGNGLIAFGALLPGIGGSMAKAGIVEALYVGEFVGLLFIWAGYAVCVRAGRPAEVGSTATPEPSVATT